MSNDPSFHQLDEVFAAILQGASVQGRLRMARGMATMLRQSQSRRIGKQEDPDGTKYEGRRRRCCVRAQASNSCGRGRKETCATGVQPAAGGDVW